jgi:hypothetical protein
MSGVVRGGIQTQSQTKDIRCKYTQYPLHLDPDTTPLQQTSRKRSKNSAISLEKDHVSIHEANLVGLSGLDWSSYTATEAEKPNIVLYPSSTSEVSSVMKICHRRYLPVTAFSGGTPLKGHCAST